MSSHPELYIPANDVQLRQFARKLDDTVRANVGEDDYFNGLLIERALGRDNGGSRYLSFHYSIDDATEAQVYTTTLVDTVPLSDCWDDMIDVSTVTLRDTADVTMLQNREPNDEDQIPDSLFEGFMQSEKTLTVCRVGHLGVSSTIKFFVTRLDEDGCTVEQSIGYTNLLKGYDEGALIRDLERLFNSSTAVLDAEAASVQLEEVTLADILIFTEAMKQARIMNRRIRPFKGAPEHYDEIAYYETSSGEDF
jgi:hypothetical protein